MTVQTVASLRVRLGEPADEDAIVEAIREMHSLGESGFFGSDGQPFPFCEGKVRDAVRLALVRHGSWIGLVECDGLIVGAVLLSLASPFYSDAEYLGEQVLFVLPEHRHSDAARDLLKLSTDLSNALNIPLAIAVMSHTNADVKTKFYARVLGSPPTGGVFLIPPRVAS